MSQASKFWDRQAAKYALKPIDDPASYEKKLAQTQARFRPDMRVLELGCGTGSTALMHAPFVADYWASDISPAMIEIARSKAAEAKLANLHFIVGTADETQGLPEHPFDAILALNLLHLLSDPAAQIAQIYERLAPGGIFVSSTGCLTDMKSILVRILPLLTLLRLAPPVANVSSAWLLETMRRTGFEIEAHWGHGQGSSYFVIASKPA